MQHRRHEKPIPRVNPSGKKVWVARWTDRKGKRHVAGTFEIRGACRAPGAGCCAQHAIDAAYERDQAAPSNPKTVGAYAESWTRRHPRSDRTNATNDHRVSRVLDVELEGIPLRNWLLADLKRRHAVELVDVLLRKQGRSKQGAVNILGALRTMAEDAITDEAMDANPFRGVKIRANDPRVSKAPRRVVVCSWEQMHAFAAAAGAARTGKAEGGSVMDEWRAVYAEAMVRTLADCGLRRGELLALYRFDLKRAGACADPTVDGPCDVTVPHLHVRRTAHEGVFLDGTKTDHGEAHPGRVVPVAEPLMVLLSGMPRRIDTQLLFPTPEGALWRESNFYRDVWEPARVATGLVGVSPHHFRHSWVSLLQAAGVDFADLAAMAGHTVETMHARYTHGLGQSMDAVRAAVGS
jgi:integrase